MIFIVVALSYDYLYNIPVPHLQVMYDAVFTIKCILACTCTCSVPVQFLSAKNLVSMEDLASTTCACVVWDLKGHAVK